MAEKSFGVKEINLIGASGTPTIGSPNNLNLNAVNVAISTNATIGGNLTVSGTVGIAGTLTYEDVTNVDAIGIITARAGVKLPDTQSLILGTDDDAEIKHTGANLVIRNTTGNIRIEPKNGQLAIQSQADANTSIYYSGSKKIETTNTGVTVTGTLAATAVTGDGSGLTGIAVTEAPVTDYTISANGSSAYRFHGGGVDETANNPDLYLIRGQKYRFNNTTGSNHPFAIRVSNGGSAYTDGVSGDDEGVQLFTVPYAAPASLVYQCTIHGGMVGNIYIRGGSSTANISNNADNRVVTGGSGGNLNGEANLTFDGSTLKIATSAGTDAIININEGTTTNPLRLMQTATEAVIQCIASQPFNIRSQAGSGSTGYLAFWTRDVERVRITPTGKVNIGGDYTQSTRQLGVVSSVEQVASFEYNDADADGAEVRFYHNSSSPADDDTLAFLQFSGKNSADEVTLYSGITAESSDVTNGTEDGNIIFSTRSNGTFGERVRIEADGRVNIGAGSGNQSTLSPILQLHKASSAATAYLHITNTDSGITNNDGLVIGFNGSNDALFFNKESTPIRFATAGTERFRITSGGRVLIGTTSAFATGQAYRLFQIGQADGGWINLARTGVPSSGNHLGAIQGFTRSADGNYHDTTAIDFKADGTISNSSKPSRIEFYTTSSSSTSKIERLQIDSNGNKIIKNGRLNINSTFIDFSGSISTPSTAAAIYRPADNTLAFSTANTEKVRIDSVGRLLVGTTSAMSTGSNDIRDTIQAVAPAGAQLLLARNDSAVSSTNRLGEIAALTNDTDGNGFKVGATIRFEADAGMGNNDYPTAIIFKTCEDGSGTLTERVRIRSEGFLGVGVNPAVPGHIKSLSGNGEVFRVESSGSASNQVFIGFRRSSNSNTGGIRRDGSGSGPEFFSGSDRRIKTNIVDMDSVLDKIKQLSLKKFDYKDGSGSGIGLIAQDLINIFPNKVSKDESDEGSGDTVPDGIEPWTVGHNFTFELLKAVQELISKVEALEGS